MYFTPFTICPAITFGKKRRNASPFHPENRAQAILPGAVERKDLYAHNPYNIYCEVKKQTGLDLRLAQGMSPEQVIHWLNQQEDFVATARRSNVFDFPQAKDNLRIAVDRAHPVDDIGREFIRTHLDVFLNGKKYRLVFGDVNEMTPRQYQERIRQIQDPELNNRPILRPVPILRLRQKA